MCFHEGDKMKFFLQFGCVLALGFSLTLTAAPAMAGEATEGFSACLVKSTSEADKKALVKWIFIAIAEHPDISAFATITETDKMESSKAVGMMMTRLVSEAWEVLLLQSFLNNPEY